MIEIWLSFNNREDVLQLPIVPFYTLTASYYNQTINLHEIGDVNVPGNRGLKGLELASFIPAKDKNYYFSAGEPDPARAIALIEKWAESKRPIRVIITERNINLAMMIESFSYGDADKSGDVEYSLSLKEYVFLEAPKFSTDGATTTETATSGSHGDAKEWKVSYGDTLTGIAMAKWGDSSKYEEIIELNRGLIKNPDSLKAIEGKVLKLESD